MSRTLNQLIEHAIMGGEEVEETSPRDAHVSHEEAEEAPELADYGDVEKIASALEFLGRRGLGAMLKEAGKHGDGNVGTNAGQRTPAPKGGIDTKGLETGTHHPALASNAAAIAYDKKVKPQRTAPALKKVLDATPFADPTLKKTLTGAAGKGDKNIHSKSAHDLEEIRKELARRGATPGGQ